MPLTVNIHQAKTNLSKLLERVANGEEIIIAKAGKPVAVLSPFYSPRACRLPGNDAGKVIISAAFDEPLAEFESL